jgi:uncharacterized membrane protein
VPVCTEATNEAEVGRIVAKLKDKIENGLNDVRILILSAQVLVGAAFRSFFQPEFTHLPYLTQALQLGGLGLMLLGLGPLLLPAAFHQIVEQGRDTIRIKNLTMVVLDFGTVPFAVGLAVNFYMVLQKLAGSTIAWLCGVFIGGVALLFWYGIGYMKRERSRMNSARENDQQDEQKEDQESKLTDKIKQVLMETRMVLPGTQALLGFQIIIFLVQDFDRLPRAIQWTHFGSLLSVTISAILLITPAAYHRIAVHGEDSEEFRSFAGRIMLLAMFFLGLGLATDFFVVTYKITNSMVLSFTCAGTLLLFFYGLWFGYSRWKRSQLEQAAIDKQ